MIEFQLSLDELLTALSTNKQLFIGGVVGEDNVTLIKNNLKSVLIPKTLFSKPETDFNNPSVSGYGQEVYFGNAVYLSDDIILQHDPSGELSPVDLFFTLERLGHTGGLTVIPIFKKFSTHKEGIVREGVVRGLAELVYDYPEAVEILKEIISTDSSNIIVELAKDAIEDIR